MLWELGWGDIHVYIYFVSLKNVIPTREEKSRLLFAGLEEEKITFIKSADPEQFKLKLEEIFPKLKSCGRFELIRSAVCQRLQLETLQIPKWGYSCSYLSNENGLGQAICYIRSVQRDIDMDNLPDIVFFFFHCYIPFSKY
jgi:hypothetical protein